MKKKYRTYVVIGLITLVCTACTIHKEVIDFSVEQDQLSQSMKNYYEVSAIDEQKGTHMQAKLLKFHVSEKDDILYDYYELVVAPMTSEELQIKSINFYPNVDLLTYFEENHKDRGSNLEDWKYVFSKVNYPNAKEVKDITAYHYTVLFDNLGNDMMQNSGMKRDEFTEAMKTITVRIEYENLDAEDLVLTAQGDVETTPLQIEEAIQNDTLVTGIKPFDELTN